MTHKNILSLFSFFIVFLLIFTSFLMINVDAKIDYLIEYAGGVDSLQYTSNEHIVMNENGDEMGYAFIGRNGDSSYVNFLYRDMPECALCEKGIRQTINVTPFVAIARDSDFNIHAVYMEFNGSYENIYYKVFRWSNKKWYKTPVFSEECDKTKHGYVISDNSNYSLIQDIKVDEFDNVYIVYSEQSEDGTYAELILKRYNGVLGYWDLSQGIESEVTGENIYRYGSMALDSSSYMYLTYGKKQTGHWSDEIYYEVWFTKSTTKGNSWSSPVLIVGATAEESAQPMKTIITKNDVMYHTFRKGYGGSWDANFSFIKSFNYGSTWSSFVNISDVHCAGGSVTVDSNNIVYFTYSKQREYNITEDSVFNLYGKKYENYVLGDEIQITTDNFTMDIYLNLVFSNTYNQYADSGIIGIYENRLVGNYAIRYLEMNYNDFLLGFGFFEIEIIPDKPIYYVYDTITIKTEVLSGGCYWSRIYDNNGDYVNGSGWFFYLTGTYNDMWTIPDGYENGTWTIRMYLDAGCFIPPDWDNDTHFDFEFEVMSSDLDYYIELSPDYIEVPNTIDVKFSAKKGEAYNLMLIKVNTGESVGNLSIPTMGVTQDYVITDAFMIEIAGTYFVKLMNDTYDLTYAVSNVIKASIYPQYPTYRTNLKKKYPYTDSIKFAIYSDSIKQYRWYVFNELEQSIGSGKYSGDVTVVQIYVDSDDIGTCYLLVYDYDGSPSDTNSLYVEFQIYDPEGLTGDPVIDVFIGIPSWIKAIVGVIIVLGFVFIPFTLSQYIAGSHKLDVPPVIYAICGGIGVTLCTLIGLFGWEIMFFICVIAGISLVISYVWQQRGD